MEDRETQRKRKYGESKTIRIMMATVPHVTSGLGLRKLQADGFLFDRVYKMAQNNHQNFRLLGVQGRNHRAYFIITEIIWLSF